MPIFEYQCESCGESFEHLVRTSAAEEAPVCARCESKLVRRKLSTFSARSGSGPMVSEPPGCGRCGDPYGPCGMD